MDMAIAYLHEAGSIRTPFATCRLVMESVESIKPIGSSNDESSMIKEE